MSAQHTQLYYKVQHICVYLCNIQSNTFNNTFFYLILTVEPPSSFCTSSCNTQLTDTQYQLCCDPNNYGNVIQVMRENSRKAYLVCPLKAADWCIYSN